MKSCCICQSLENWQENNSAFYRNILSQKLRRIMIGDAHFRTLNDAARLCAIRVL